MYKVLILNLPYKFLLAYGHFPGSFGCYRVQRANYTHTTHTTHTHLNYTHTTHTTHTHLNYPHLNYPHLNYPTLTTSTLPTPTLTTPTLINPHTHTTHTHSHEKALSRQRSVQKDPFQFCRGGHKSLANEGNMTAATECSCANYHLNWVLYMSTITGMIFYVPTDTGM